MATITGKGQLAIPVNTTEMTSQVQLDEPKQPLDVLADLIAKCVLPRVLGVLVAEYAICDRDHQVRAAILQLRAHQKSISPDQIPGAVDKFINYLYSSLGNDGDKQRATNALLKPKEQDEDFGPLINGESFSLLGLQMSGQDLIGRLWIFASELPEPEQTNAKEGMISGLRDSYDFDGRVCNSAKTERLAVTVLQGRLPEVNMEPEITSPRVFTARAVEIFFELEAHRTIPTKANLLEAATRFCDINPDVNRQEFIEEINSYAQQEEMGE